MLQIQPRSRGATHDISETPHLFCHHLICVSITHRIHGAGIYANIWGILMVNVPIYSIHGSYGL